LNSGEGANGRGGGRLTLPEADRGHDRALDAEAFRSALGCFATGITVVTAVGPSGELLGITANSFNSVSLDPPLVLFSLHRAAYSLGAFTDSGHFVVNILGEDQRELSARFAMALVDKWSGVDYEVWDTGAPILKGCLAAFECRTRANYDGGDHVIFLGEVLRLRCAVDGRPLLYFRGRYRGLAEG
jgi:flavin reductase (DIM6/NTAB) family NADH-FMN oxidoreductase RutF